MREFRVNLGARTYPIIIGRGLLKDPSVICAGLRSSQVLIVSNQTVAPLYLASVRDSLAGKRCSEVILPDGEQYKTLDTVNLVFEKLLAEKHARTTTLVALGGGVIGDMTGFAAACYQRGVSFVQLPTTLLAQVDSSVGGKTGVNHRLGKNMIGAFHQPSAVIIDTDTLKTLPAREYSAGMAEVIKYGLLGDGEFLEWLEANQHALMQRDPDLLEVAIERSCRNKAAIVERDEYESGDRALLNLGHTFGHAIEAWQEYKGMLHGEAVAVGMLMAANLSCRLGYLDPQALSRVAALLQAAGLPVNPPAGMTAEIFWQYMQLDKKVLDGSLRLVLLKKLGAAFVYDNAGLEHIRMALQEPGT